jgi:O-Antigen ligase
MVLRRARQDPEPGARAAACAVVIAMVASAFYLGHKAGLATGLAVLAAEAAGLLVLANVELALLAFIALGILAEDDATWGINLSAVYHHGTGQPSPFQGLELLAVAATLLYLVSTRIAPRFPRPFGIAMLLTVAALLAGLAQGIGSGVSSRSALLGTVETTLPALVVPVLIVNVVRTRAQLHRALALGAGLAGFKALAGLFVVFSGLGAVQGSFGRITYFQAPSNLLLMMFLLAMVAAWLSRTPVPRWMSWLVPLVVASLLLSFRRTIWLGTLVALPIIAFPASGRVGRRSIVPSIALVLIVGYIALSTGIGGGLQGPLVTRATSISLSKISQNQQDRYRIDERRNVWAAIERQPITGLGIGVPWPVRYPVGINFTDQTDFAHIAALFWWMKMGIVGLLAYLSLIISVIVAGTGVWRGHDDRQIRVFGLASVGFAVGLAVVELANTTLGASERGTMLFGVVAGLLASCWAQLHSPVGSATADTVPES